MTIDIVMHEDGLNSLFKPFVDQPFDGLLYLGGYAPNYTIYLPKLCASKAIRKAGFIAYADEPETEYCRSKVSYKSSQNRCLLPRLNVTNMKILGPGAPLKQSDEMLQAFIVPIPEIALPQEIFKNFTNDLGLSPQGGMYYIDCDLRPKDVLMMVNVLYGCGR
ncbi:hypothetical protein AAVH_10801 [Aphelenchoides avenae]|nr:hypothetical protein AAVH_10801 [Aphelenchus avenae]